MGKGLKNQGHCVGVVEDDKALDHGDVVGHLGTLVHVDHVAKQLATVGPETQTIMESVSYLTLKANFDTMTFLI